MKKTYDVLVIGPVSLDHNIDYQGNERKEVGGAVVASGFAAAKSGNRTAVFTKLNPADADVEERFAGSGADVYWKPSQATCSTRHRLFSRRVKRAQALCVSVSVERVISMFSTFRFKSRNSRSTLSRQVLLLYSI